MNYAADEKCFASSSSSKLLNSFALLNVISVFCYGCGCADTRPIRPFNWSENLLTRDEKRHLTPLHSLAIQGMVGSAFAFAVGVQLCGDRSVSSSSLLLFLVNVRPLSSRGFVKASSLHIQRYDNNNVVDIFVPDILNS